ncbi:hypothetical protein Y032_0146g2528 [Ancylostoma ceylanicum]|nr:hypothetical protein Y032_0146g2528 [Ancylostoma ceylanicum]
MVYSTDGPFQMTSRNGLQTRGTVGVHSFQPPRPEGAISLSLLEAVSKKNQCRLNEGQEREKEFVVSYVPPMMTQSLVARQSK